MDSSNSHQQIYDVLLEDYGDSMSNLSAADHGVKFISSQSKAIDLDSYAEFCQINFNCSGNPSTCDAWYIDSSKNCHLIEFKSGQFNFNTLDKNCPNCNHSFSEQGKRNKEIFIKCAESLLIISEITNKPLDFFRNNMKFILVVEKMSPLVDMHYHAAKRAKMPFIPQEISRLHKMYFKDVELWTKSDFEAVIS
ncbi:MAG: hypothetical protein LBE57_06485 [Methanosarcinales archaeon]|jgi:hypothetical protein|nr:hypothetical protein [Methanosarcinales archaeon]